MSFHLEFWDVMLVAAVSAQTTLLAYLYDARWKALVWMLPIPFTVASLAVGRPIDATNILGLNVLLLYTHGVRVLHQQARVPIVLAILSSAGLCLAVGWNLARVVPQGSTAFWTAGAATLLLGWVLLRATPHRDEPGHRSPLPLWLKIPSIVLVILLLVYLKRGLGGFTTVFPMVGIVGAYESRHSLHTMARAVPGILLTIAPMMMACRLLQERLGLGLSLVVGWIVYLALMALLTRSMWKRTAETTAVSTSGPTA